MSIDGTCDQLWEASLPTGYEGHRPEARTNHASHYQVYTVYPGIIGSSAKRLLCVRHPDFEPYQYSAIDGESKDPRNGEEFLNIRLKPRKQAEGVKRDVP